jgi:hypothetical protein
MEHDGTNFGMSSDGLVYESGYYTNPGAVWLTYGADFQMNPAYPAFELEVWDYDEIGEELVGRLLFNPLTEYSPETGSYPSTWSIQTANFNVQFEVQYLW